MTAWTVFVMRDKLELELHLEFHKSGTTERDPVPTLAAGDRLHLGFPDVRRSGVVIETSGDAGVIQVEGRRWNIRLASPTERHYRSPRGMNYRVDSRCSCPNLGDLEASLIVALADRKPDCGRTPRTKNARSRP